MHTALTIAGSDSSGGAGVQADLKTMLANGVFGESVITALTAQNTMGVDAVMNVPADFIEAQMKAVFTDIFPDAVKIGMTSSVDTIEAIAAGLVKYKAKNIVLDPVMVATSGSRLLEENARAAVPLQGRWLSLMKVCSLCRVSLDYPLFWSQM
jgi:hydroxymethylpyrimidine/phosphomethylpyrimidine kinase